MQNFTKGHSVIASAFLGLIILIPLIALELINRWKFNEGFPFAVFTFTWALQTAFILIITPIIMALISRKSLLKNPLMLLLRLVGLVIIAYIWSGWIADQWPCLIGVPNCD